MRSKIRTNHSPPWYDPNDKELVANLAERTRLSDAMKRENIDLFGRNVEKGQVLEMQNAGALHLPVEPTRSAGSHRKVRRQLTYSATQTKPSPCFSNLPTPGNGKCTA